MDLVFALYSTSTSVVTTDRLNISTLSIIYPLDAVVSLNHQRRGKGMLVDT